MRLNGQPSGVKSQEVSEPQANNVVAPVPVPPPASAMPPVYAPADMGTIVNPEITWKGYINKLKASEVKKACKSASTPIIPGLTTTFDLKVKLIAHCESPFGHDKTNLQDTLNANIATGPLSMKEKLIEQCKRSFGKVTASEHIQNVVPVQFAEAMVG